MSAAISRPIQKTLKLPATIPERIVREEPPSRDAVTISWTCLEWELVKILVNSGMSTAASVPQLIIAASCPHRLGYAVPPTFKSLMSSQLIRNDVEMHSIDAIQIRRVSGASKSN